MAGPAAPTRSPGGGTRPGDQPVPWAWTRGPAHRPPAVPLWELIVAQAARTPEALAVRQWADQLTYRELVGAAAGLGARLRDLGVGPEARVGVCVPRGLPLPVSVLGVMAAGGAYVALDPTHPRQRLRDVLDDAGVDVAVVDEAGRSLLAGTGRRLVEPSLAGPAPTPAPGPARLTNAAYVLYTSGSTGRPKGVVVSHASVVSFVTATADHFGLDPSCRAIAFAALGFDVSVLDLLTPLTRGGCVQLVPDPDRVDPGLLQRFLEAHDVTWGFLPPALLPLLDPDRLPALRNLVTAGEPPGPEQVARWSAPPDRRLHNWYGPTEATVCVVGCELTGDWRRPVPIGRPLAGCHAYIVDERMDPCPVGTPGELYLGGPQLARGYWDHPGLTAERFVPDPFGEAPGGRLYRTGDRVAWEPDGRIRFLGRLDRQVKIQGQRVEIGEVESALRGHPRVLQAIADAGGEPGPDHFGELVAYLTPADAPDLTELREHCAQRLPGYMVPTRVVRLDTLPLNASGKTDLPALRALAAAADQRRSSRADCVDSGPASIDSVVAGAWSEILGTPEPRPEHEFFACGGHSLRAMRLVSALRARLGRDLTVADVYAGHTLSGLAERATAAPPLADAGTARRGNPPALSTAQRRIWFVEQLAPGWPAHNIAMAERLRGPVERAALRTALRAVAARHQPLRWRVPHRAGAPYVVVDEVRDVPLPVVDLSTRPESQRPAALRALLDAEAGTPFDLVAGPLWRATLVRLAADQHVLAITVHHLVFDGWSQDVLYRDLAAGYAAALAGEQPPAHPLPAEFGDYVAAAAERTARHGADQLRWWVDRLSDAPAVCDLPRDRPRPAAQTFRGAARSAQVDQATTAAVRALARRLDTTPHAVLLAAFGQLLRRLTGQPDLIVGVPYADRDQVAFEPLVGLLLRILPLRLRASGEASFAEHARRCHDEVREAIAHRDAPLERVVEALRVPRDLSRNPLVQVLFNMYNFAEPRLELPGCAVEPVLAGLPGSLFDLTLYVSEGADRLSLQAVYNPDLYDEDRIAGYLDSYRHLLRELATAPDEPVGQAAARPADSALPDWASPLSLPRAPDLVTQVARSTAERPTAVAVTGTGDTAGSGGELTYRELAALRDRVAAGVEAAGLSAGQTVAVLATRHVALPALLLGVLCAGARWAILDTSLPAARLARQAAAADAKALLACPGATVPEELSHLTGIDLPAAATTATSAPDGTYLAFTSGTTGEPQAVLTPQDALADFLAWYAGTFALGPRDRFALLAGLGHDPLLRDAFAPLVVGARLAVPEQQWLRDPTRLHAWLREQRITVAHLTPQLTRLLTSDQTVAPLADLRLVATAGDQLTAADVARLRALAPQARLVNLYGATETPQAHGWYEVPRHPDGEVVPVGRGVAGSALVVVDRLGRPAAMGELGEVVVRSRRLATGYLDPELTRRRFSRTPGSRDHHDRRYRTGDLGRHRPDGAVVLAGRADDQVKVRGFRVELGEIEAVLTAHPDVRAAAAVATTRGGERVIRAFAAPAQPDLRAEQLLDHLRASLPEYAVPADLQLVPAIPLTANGKLDRPALLDRAPQPGPGPAPGSGPSGELRTPTERLVAGVWRSVLGRPRVGAEDNFFDLGGHSLALVAVAVRLSAAVGREVPVVELFRLPTIRTLAGFLDGDRRSPGLDRAERRVAVRRERLRRRSPGRAGGAVAETEGSQR
ncbi:MAG: amino acid adenylation domain-containing protein [Micromonosporaceae bacterium]|nr:amino acid adenylation domain-containing protein [Micromonosporaceae bacterium]